MEELLAWYTEINLFIRLGALMFFGCLPGACTYYEEATAIDEQLAQKNTELEQHKSTFNSKRSQANRMPELIETLAFTQNQMEEAKKSLPDDFFVEDFLAKLATFALENRALMMEFTPAEKPSVEGAGYRYESLTIDVKFEGAFEQVMAFMDEVAHLQKMVQITGISMAGKSESELKKPEAAAQNNAAATPAPAGGPTANLNMKKDKNAEAIALRASSLVSGSSQFVIFRSSRNDNQMMAPIPGMDPDVGEDAGETEDAEGGAG
jgi:Tfp pilus assembly protein PilO